MKKELLIAAATATLAAASSGAFADQPTNVEITKFNDNVTSGQWDAQQLITVCSNNGNGNNHETVSTGLGCVKFVNSNFLEAPDYVNVQVGEDCLRGPDCDPKPVD